MTRPLPFLLILTVGALVLVLSPTASAKGLRAPALASPPDEQAVSSVPAFTWGKVKKADRYEFMLSADANFGSIVLGKGVGSFTTKNLAATITRSLPDGTYWWRVRAISAKNRAGAWSARRSVRKTWAPAPELLGPADDGSIRFPTSPLVLRWGAVPRAYKYRVYVGTDPSLGTLVLGKAPVETSATVFAPGGTLAPGKYYWAVEPVDAAGHRGMRSRVGSFVWSWPSTTETSFRDLVADPRMTEPQLSWKPIPGAVSYQVEVNFSQDFAPGSRVCCDAADTGLAGGLALGTSVSPKRILPNNVYHWRVRGIDSDGNAGGWNAGTPFDQSYGSSTDAIRNLRLRNQSGDLPTGSTTDSPVLTWDPVPGAAKYGVELTPYSSGACNWASTDHWNVQTMTNAFAFMAPSRSGTIPFSTNGLAISVEGRSLVDDRTYCVRVHARRGDDRVIGPVTQLGGLGQPAFTYDAHVAAPPPDTLLMTDSHYAGPQTGSTTPRAPLFTWQRLPGAHSYYVVVSKNDAFTNVVDVALTNSPAYAPRTRTYADDNTPYYWAVVPAKQANGGGVTSQPSENAPRSFNKRSVPPVLLSPARDAVVEDHPVFHWTSGDPVTEVPEGAREYRLQVSSDPSFVDLLDDVTTTATSYVSAESYPADTVLYWRVRVTDANGIGLAWSETGTFRRRLPTPAITPENSSGGSIIPALTWSPVQGAMSYDVHVDQSDGTRKDFNLKGTAFTPTLWYGTGVWRWQVRANFLGGNSRNVSSGYTPDSAFTRVIPSPDGVRAETRKGRILMRWEPNLGAGIREYRVDFSSVDSFSTIGQTIRTQNLVVAPDVSKPPFADGGRVFWRISAVDEGNNAGGAAVGRFVTARRMVMRVSGGLVRGRRSRIVVALTDARGRKVRKAKVRVSGRPVGTSSRRTGKRGTASFDLRARRRGVVVVRATKDGFRPAQARITVP